MNILITGAGGLVGRATQTHLRRKGHAVYAMSRSDKTAPFYWRDQGNHQWHIRWSDAIAIDAVIHLAGEGVAGGRWTPAKKQRIRDSRIDTTRALVRTFASLKKPPGLFMCASAIGFYGDYPGQIVDEDSPGGQDFLARLALNWETEAQGAKQYGIRTINMRTGLVLAKDGGALQKMLPAFRLGLGGKLGDGRQIMSWVSIDEIPKMIEYLIDQPTAKGPINLVSRHPVDNLTFTKTLGGSLHRPTLFPVPKIIIKKLFGEMGELLLLSSIEVRPTRLIELGYHFDDDNLADVFQKLLQS
ncbi:MAG: TIGR01777 family protein [Gammaproteobacteria bacterium]|nr:MAG: TIGR01777 family protein [Gammaproteobacteria bacterium]